jgi:hypothetical protein
MPVELDTTDDLEVRPEASNILSKPQAPKDLEFDLTAFKTKQAFGALLVPLFPFGEWEHPWYGMMNFDETVANLAIANFHKQTCAYDPALFIGHNNIGARAAVGFLENVLIHDSCLWGLYAAVCPQTYLDVKQQRYRYSSMEIDMDYYHPRKRQNFGPTLIGCALTNEPFLTEMPDVKAFSLGVENSTRRSFAMNLDSCMTYDFANVKPSVLPVPEQLPLVPEDTLVNLSTSMQTEITETSNTPDSQNTLQQPVPEQLAPTAISTAKASNTNDVAFAAMAAELAELKVRNREFEQLMLANKAELERIVEAQKVERQERRLSILNASTLSTAAKSAYLTALKAPGLAEETADELISQVKALSVEEERTYLQQHGTDTPTGAGDVNAPTATSPETPAPFAYENYLKQLQQTLSK